MIDVCGFNCPPCNATTPFIFGLMIGGWIGLMAFLIWFKLYLSKMPAPPSHDLILLTEEENDE